MYEGVSVLLFKSQAESHFKELIQIAYHLYGCVHNPSPEVFLFPLRASVSSLQKVAPLSQSERSLIRETVPVLLDFHYSHCSDYTTWNN